MTQPKKYQLGKAIFELDDDCYLWKDKSYACGYRVCCDEQDLLDMGAQPIQLYENNSLKEIAVLVESFSEKLSKNYRKYLDMAHREGYDSLASYLEDKLQPDEPECKCPPNFEWAGCPVHRKDKPEKPECKCACTRLDCAQKGQHVPECACNRLKQMTETELECTCSNYDGSGKSTCGFDCPVHKPHPSETQCGCGCHYSSTGYYADPMHCEKCRPHPSESGEIKLPPSNAIALDINGCELPVTNPMWLWMAKVTNTLNTLTGKEGGKE